MSTTAERMRKEDEAQVRANTNRSGALVFGRLADDYDLGRIPVLPEEAAAIRARAFQGKAPARSGRLLEVGAGTGQLTRALTGQAEHVTVLEPDEPFREVLAALLSARLRDGSARILGSRFEDALDTVDAGSIDEIWSCDAFHWIDPSVGYDVAWRLTTGNGRLILLWRFPFAADPGIRRALNDVFRDLSPDLVRDEDFDNQIDRLCADGRAEMAASGRFQPVQHWWKTRELPMSPDRFASLQLSLGHIAGIDTPERQRLRHEILETVGLSELRVTLRTYVVVGAKA